MIDTHCHLTDPQFRDDLTEVLERARVHGVSRIINAGYDLATSRAAVEMQKNHDWLLPAAGIHPNEAAVESLSDFTALEDICRTFTVCAIGETGLDFYRGQAPRPAQAELFRRHIQLARDLGLPLLIHTRNSFDEALAILEAERYHRGVFHCFSGTADQAGRALDLGFYLGFGGVLTYSKKMREVFCAVPRNQILLETDAPFLPPQSQRGRRNEPSFMKETLRAAAQLTGQPELVLEEQFDRNAGSLFSL